MLGQWRFSPVACAPELRQHARRFLHSRIRIFVSLGGVFDEVSRELAELLCSALPESAGPERASPISYTKRVAGSNHERF